MILRLAGSLVIYSREPHGLPGADCWLSGCVLAGEGSPDAGGQMTEKLERLASATGSGGTVPEHGHLDAPLQRPLRAWRQLRL